MITRIATISNSITTVYSESIVVKPKKGIRRIAMKFYNNGNDVVTVNDKRLSNGDELFIGGGDALLFDETQFRIVFENLLSDKNLVAIETVLLRFENVSA